MMNDVFNNDVFSVTSLTAKVNKQPYVPGQVGKTGIFEEQGVATTTILIEEQNGTLGLVAPSPRGSSGETTAREARKMRSFPIPHYQRDDSIMADEVQGVRAFGEEQQLQTIEQVVDQKTMKHTRALDATLEHQRLGAIKGIVTDKNGNTMLNLFNEFGIIPPDPINFHLDVDATKLRTLCYELVVQIEDTLDADSYGHIHSYVGRDFWKWFIEHKAVKDTYLNTAQAAELRGDMNVDKFEFGGIVWERYRTGKQATAANGNTPFIGLEEARFVPVGVPELFITRFAPADYEETVNTIGLPRYARQWRRDDGKGRNLDVQMNAISLCTRPDLLFSGVAR